MYTPKAVLVVLVVAVFGGGCRDKPEKAPAEESDAELNALLDNAEFDVIPITPEEMAVDAVTTRVIRPVGPAVPIATILLRQLGLRATRHFALRMGQYGLSTGTITNVVRNGQRLLDQGTRAVIYWKDNIVVVLDRSGRFLVTTYRGALKHWRWK